MAQKFTSWGVFSLACQVRNTISTLYYLSSSLCITGSDEGKSAEESQGSWNSYFLHYLSDMFDMLFVTGLLSASCYTES